MAWIYLVAAGLLEVFWSTMMKLSLGFSKLDYALLTILGMVFSFIGLIAATKHLPISLAYPIWTGIGAAGSVLIGVLVFNEHLSWLTLLFVVLLVISLIGIKVTAN